MASMREVLIEDVFAVTLPPDMDPHDPDVRRRLTLVAKSLTWDQYLIARPEALRFWPINWLITNDADEADAFQPAHDCPTCRAGADQMRAFLRANPGRYVVLGNLRYVEVWLDD
jgi:hypothetical protein